MKDPVKYSDELADEICKAISITNLGLKRLCDRHPDWPHYMSIFRWLSEPDKEYFRLQYARAKQAQAEFLIDEIVEISDDSSQDTISFEKPNGEEVEIENKEWVNRSKLRVDTRKWIASKVLPKVYGDKIDVTSGGEPIQKTVIKWGDKELEV